MIETKTLEVYYHGEKWFQNIQKNTTKASGVARGFLYAYLFDLIFRFNESVSVAFTFVDYVYLVGFCIAEYEEIMS